MNLKIEWSPRASSEYENLIDYLIVHFGITVARRFDSHLEKVFELILKYPKMYPESEKRKGIYRCVLSKQTSLYYRLDKDKIELVAFWDNRRDLKKLKL